MKRTEEISRITIDIPRNIHKKFKAVAAACGKSMREMVVEYFSGQIEECPYDHTPNAKTQKAIRDAKKGIGVYHAKDAPF